MLFYWCLYFLLCLYGVGVLLFWGVWVRLIADLVGRGSDYLWVMGIVCVIDSLWFGFGFGI